MKHLILVLLILTGCHIQTNPGSGMKVGKIVKLSKEGLFSKTWEGELIRGGLNDGSGSFGNSFHFTIEEDSLAHKAMEYMDADCEVTIYYEREFITALYRSEESSPAFVKQIIRK